MSPFSNAAEWSRTSWVDSANVPGNGFPLQSLPYCVFAGEDGAGRIGVGIGSFGLDFQACADGALFEGLPAATREACEAAQLLLNSLMACAEDRHAHRGARA